MHGGLLPRSVIRPPFRVAIAGMKERLLLNPVPELSQFVFCLPIFLTLSFPFLSFPNPPSSFVWPFRRPTSPSQPHQPKASIVNLRS
jgi:hypothetical protein